MANLDSLQIQIVADANDADKAIVSLAQKLDRLTTSMASLNRTNLSGFSMSMRNISTSMQSLKDVKLPDYTRLAKGINKFASIDTANIHNAGTAMQELGKSLRILDGVNLSDDAIKVADFVKSVSKFGNKSATQAVDNIPRLATALRNLMGTLSGAPLVSRNLIDMTNALANLARTGSSSGRASTSLARSLDLYSSSSNRARKSTWSLASAFGKMYASYWLVFRAFRQIGKAIDISSQLTEIQNVVDVTFADMTYKVEQFAETSIEKFGMSELTLNKTASQFQAMGSAMNINSKNIASANKYLNSQTDQYVSLGNSMADVSMTLTKLTADMSSFYNVEQKVIAEDLQSIFTGQTKPLRQYGIDLTEVNLKQWAMNEGLNSNIESMTQAEKVMLRYQYVLAHTTQAQGDFARTANTWANQIRILKQNFEQLGVIIGQTFINMLKPLVRMLNTVMSSILAFAETVSNALGKIFGWKFEVGAGGITNELEDGAGYADDLSDAMGNSADEAKRLRTYLLGIDELNVIDPQDVASGGSGGAGGAGGGGASGGQWVKGETIFEDYKSEIDSLFELGDYISQTLSRAMESIEWEKIYEKARGFGTGLADFLNGLISPRLFGNLGKTIANSLNTALQFLNSFGKTFEWDEFGESIAWGVNDFFENFDFGLLADTLNTWVNGLQDALAGFLKTLKWDSVVSGLGEFLGALEGDTILTLLGIVNIKKFGNAVGRLIGKYVGGFSTDGMAESSSELGKKTSVPMGTAEGVDALTIAFEGLSFAIEACVIAAEGLIILDTVKDPLIDMLGSMTDNQQKAEELKETYEGLAGSVQLLMDTAVPVKSFFDGLPTVMGGATNANLAMAEALDKIAEGTTYTDEQLKKMQETWSLTSEDIETLRQAMIDANPEVLEITDSFESLNDYSFESLEDVSRGLQLIKDGVVPAKDAVSEFSKPMWDMNDSALAFFETISNGETSLEQFSKDMELVGENISAGLLNGAENAEVGTASGKIFEKVYSSICDVFGIHSPAETMKPLGEFIFLGIVEGFQGGFADFEESLVVFWEEYIQPWFNSEDWSELYAPIKTELEATWASVVDWWTTSGIYRWYNDNVKPWFNKENWTFNGIKDGLKQSFDNAINAIKTVWNGFADWFNSIMKIEIEPIQIMGQTLYGGGSFTLANLPKFATGGFPEDGLFMANHGELVGKFSNGRTVVANNQQIIDGIALGVSQANTEEVALLGQAVGILTELVGAVREGKSITIDGRELVEAYDNRKVRNGYAF